MVQHAGCPPARFEARPLPPITPTLRSSPPRGELLEAIVRANTLRLDDIISVIFTLTPDLDAAYPTRAAREMGWTHVALLDAQQPRVAGDLQRCLRVLIHCNSETSPQAIRHIYLGDAKKLRPDLDVI